MRKLYMMFVIAGMFMTAGFTELNYTADFTDADIISEEIEYIYDSADYDYVENIISESENSGYWAFKSKDGNDDKVLITKKFFSVSDYINSSYFLDNLALIYNDVSTEDNYADLSINISLPTEIDSASFKYVIPQGVKSNNADIVSDKSGEYEWDLNYASTDKTISVKFRTDGSSGFSIMNFMESLNLSFELIFIIVFGLGLVAFVFWAFLMHNVNNKV